MHRSIAILAFEPRFLYISVFFHSSTLASLYLYSCSWAFVSSMLRSSTRDESDESTDVVSLIVIYFLEFSIFKDESLFYPSSLILLLTYLFKAVMAEVYLIVLNLRNGLSEFLFVSISFSGFRLTWGEGLT